MDAGTFPSNCVGIFLTPSRMETGMLLTRPQAQAFYDSFGSKQAFYEDAALDDLIAHAAFEQSASVFELASGTGRLAQCLLSRHLPATVVPK
jgi:hypothetical protein